MSYRRGEGRRESAVLSDPGGVARRPPYRRVGLRGEEYGRDRGRFGQGEKPHLGSAYFGSFRFSVSLGQFPCHFPNSFACSCDHFRDFARSFTSPAAARTIWSISATAAVIADRKSVV